MQPQLLTSVRVQIAAKKPSVAMQMRPQTQKLIMLQPRPCKGLPAFSTFSCASVSPAIKGC
jgi:hypothetical protein